VLNERTYPTPDSGLTHLFTRSQAVVAYTVIHLVTPDCTRGVIDPLYHSRHNGRDKQYECDRGIKWSRAVFTKYLQQEIYKLSQSSYSQSHTTLIHHRQKERKKYAATMLLILSTSAKTTTRPKITIYAYNSFIHFGSGNAAHINEQKHTDKIQKHKKVKSDGSAQTRTTGTNSR